MEDVAQATAAILFKLMHCMYARVLISTATLRWLLFEEAIFTSGGRVPEPAS